MAARGGVKKTAAGAGAGAGAGGGGAATSRKRGGGDRKDDGGMDEMGDFALPVSDGAGASAAIGGAPASAGSSW